MVDLVWTGGSDDFWCHDCLRFLFLENAIFEGEFILALRWDEKRFPFWDEEIIQA